ncbi:ABC transporter substrate-binding protein [Paenibacillus sp. VCA1]|uniref:ABC transporter substrate-binding protein n=1 Tax=Paenibacillus sp. VCA1 TaxID=3039148 RepID=UPI0028729542|nr:ABC transporter substrate-binding protein [Paenibacillus sp. VCA1]MDR9855869.1 ABC transporter substrate-binding protein [Paenibacillus sp. VCA1]
MRKIGVGLWITCLIAIILTACSGGGPNRQTSESGIGSKDAAGTNDGGSVAGKAQKDDPVSGGKKTIVYSMFFPDDRFEQAKKKYEQLHPNVEIDLQTFYTDDAHIEADHEKFVQNTNTAMLAGKGPDLLQSAEFVNILPTDNYVKHRLLEDLGDWMDKDSTFRKEDYFGNILDNVRIGKGLYSVPLGFFLEGFAGDENVIAQTGVPINDKTWSWNDFMNTAKQLTASKGSPSALLFGGPENLLSDIAMSNYDLFVDSASRKAHFESAAFTGLMNQVKSMYDNQIVSQDMRNPAYFSTIQINSPWDYLVILRERGEHMKFYIKPHAQETNAGGYFRPYASISMNSNSKVKAEAWDFLKFMMSEEIQTSSMVAGFPINKKAYANQVKQLKAKGTVKTYKEGPLHGMEIKVDQAKLDQLEALVNGAVHQVEYKSDQVRDMIVNESSAFFSGQKSADDVAKLIQNKVTTYLNE